MKKLMIVAVTTAMIALMVSNLPASISWERTYPELGSSVVFSICQTTDGGYAFTGVTQLEYDYGDLYIAKVDSLGNLLDHRIFHRSDCTYGKVIKETPGGLAVLGADYSGPAGQSNCSFWLLKTDSNGDTLWMKNYGTKAGPRSMDICLDSGFIMTGYIEVENPGDYLDILLVRADKNGNLVWEKNLGGYCGQQIRTREDGYYDLLADDNGPWFLELDNNGDTLWTKHLTGSLNYFSPTSDNGYIMTGSPRFSRELWVAKTDGNAEIEWERTYLSGEDYQNHYGHTIWQTNDDGYIVIADIFQDPNTKRAVWLLKLNEFGDTTLTRIFTGPNDEGCMVEGAAPTLDGGAIIAGRGGAYGSYLLKTDENGCVGVNEDDNDNLLQVIRVFPNPSRGQIYFQTDSPNPIELKIYDITGRLVKEVMVEKKMRIDLPNGIYFWQAENQQGKIIVVK